MNGPNFFSSTNKKGENAEIKADLNSEYRERRKDAVKRVIANMTVGKDVSNLFTDVVKNMQTEDIELKKLAYLYLINYAKTQPDLVILVVNSFVKDSDDPNPLIRALAIRTMGCLRAEKILDYLLESLRKGLKDEDPYVRKTAALCVAKMYDLSPHTTIDNGFLVILQDLLSDRNPMVIANSVAALMDIAETSAKKDLFSMDLTILTKLLAALNECTEWGQICILNALANYRPVDSKDAAEIVERVVPRLQHANASVVLAAIKILITYLPFLQNDELAEQILKKISPSLVSLLSTQSEIQYVAIRNINIILQKIPNILNQEVRVFFTKYNDPLYVKLEKLKIIVKLSSERNVDQVLSELREYANEVDVDFVRKAIRAIGQCAIKIESAAEKCINTLLELIKQKVEYVVQEAISVIKDIFRKYPNRYESIIPALCENLDVFDEPDAKSSLIWIIGEYAERLSNAQELLEHFSANFLEEDCAVQLQLLTAIVKLFLKRPGTVQALMQKILQTATQVCDNPDIRDRAYIYWRLLSTDPQVAKMVIFGERPSIEMNTSSVSESLLDELIQNISSLASVYHISPSLFGSTSYSEKRPNSEEDQEQEEDMQIAQPGGFNLLELDFDPLPNKNSTNSPAKPSTSKKMAIDDLLDLDMDTTYPANSEFSPMGPSPGYLNSALNHQQNVVTSLNGEIIKTTPVVTSSNDDPFASLTAPIATSTSEWSSLSKPNLSYPELPLLLTSEQGQGLEIKGSITKKPTESIFELEFINKSQQFLSDFAIQFNFNSYGLAPCSPLSISTINPGSSTRTLLGLMVTDNIQPSSPNNVIQVAVKNNLGVFYFSVIVNEEMNGFNSLL